MCFGGMAWTKSLSGAVFRNNPASNPLDSSIAPAAPGPHRPHGFAAVDLQRDGPLASENLEHAFLVVTRQWAGFSIPMTDFQIIDPGGDLGVLAGAADAGAVPILHAPGLEPLLGGAGRKSVGYGKSGDRGGLPCRK